MESGPLAKKLLIKPGFRVGVVGAPNGYRETMKRNAESAEVVDGVRPGLDVVQLFARNKAELESSVRAAAEAVKPGGLLWVCYPKGGKKAGTDLNRDILWEAMGKYDLIGVTLVAIDEEWSAMRFRPSVEVGS